jgi:hypothetical protein
MSAETELARIATILSNLKSGGYTDIIKITGAQVGVDGATYGSGDVLGDKCPIKIEAAKSPFGTGIIHSVIIQDLSKQSGALDIVFFDSNPTATTFTDNAALDIADADLPKVIGVVSVLASDYAAFNDNSVATVKGISLPVKSLSSNNLWIAVVSRDTKTYVADELSIAISILQD